MATVVQLKRSETSGVIPTANDIAVAELAVNLADGALYTKRTDGSIIELGGSDQAILFVDQTDMGSVADADGYSFDLGAVTDAGSSTPYQYTDTDARESISVTDSGGGGSLVYNNTTGVITYTGPTTTDYRTAFGPGTGIDITNGTISSTITQYTDSLARAAISVTDSGGDGSLSYNSTTGVITYAGPSSSDVRAHFTAGTGIAISEGSISSTITQYTDSLARAAISVTDSGGDGSLSYNNTTGVITYTGPSASDVRAHFSAGTGITITSGAIAVDTSTIATQSYVNTAVSNLVDSAPATLDTLNELAAALGDDANFSTTISTSLGNRLRIDVNDQSLTSQQKTNALTNLGITADVTEINYIDGVTSAIQTQLNAKAPTASPTFTGTVTLPSDTSVGNVSATELGYLDGVSSAIQTQINSKASTGKAIAMAIVFGG